MPRYFEAFSNAALANAITQAASVASRKRGVGRIPKTYRSKVVSGKRMLIAIRRGISANAFGAGRAFERAQGLPPDYALPAGPLLDRRVLQSPASHPPSGCKTNVR